LYEIIYKDKFLLSGSGLKVSIASNSPDPLKSITSQPLLPQTTSLDVEEEATAVQNVLKSMIQGHARQILSLLRHGGLEEGSEGGGKTGGGGGGGGGDGGGISVPLTKVGGIADVNIQEILNEQGKYLPVPVCHPSLSLEYALDVTTTSPWVFLFFCVCVRM
jgi:hypothetical protein